MQKNGSGAMSFTDLTGRGNSMKKKFAFIIVLYTIFLVIANILMGGIPTYPGDIAIICFCIYIPLMIPIVISLVGVQTCEDVDEKKKIRSVCKLCFVYTLFVIIIYWSFFKLYFTEGMRLLPITVTSCILSIVALIIVSKVCRLK